MRPAVMHRARALGVQRVVQGAEDKVTPWEALRGELELPAEACAHIGDDLPDVPVFVRCGFAVTVPHAPQVVRARAHYVTAPRRRHGRRARALRADPRRAGRSSTRSTRPSAPERRTWFPRRAPRIDRLIAWSPILLLGSLAALTYWLDAQVQPPAPRASGASRHDPDLYIENLPRGELRRARATCCSRWRRRAPSTTRTTTASISWRRRSC